MTKVYILIPMLRDDGAIKGAVAVANGLSEYYETTLVVLKKILPYEVYIKPKVRIILLNKSIFWISKYRFYNKLLKEENNSKPVSISMCFSADLINLFARNNASVVASVRASMPVTYTTGYGYRGHIWSSLHVYVLKKIEYVLSMSASMSKQLKKFHIEGVTEIGNFIDEESLEKERVKSINLESKVKRLVFVGSLNIRKKVNFLIDSLYELKLIGVKFNLDIVGDGELRNDLETKVERLELGGQIKFHGHHSNPYSILQAADYFVLPSLAEGVSRASLEALFFGIPCILRDVDANSELIKNGVNGYLFTTDEEFINLLKKASISNEFKSDRKSLIPTCFTYENGISKLNNFINEIANEGKSIYEEK